MVTSILIGLIVISCIADILAPDDWIPAAVSLGPMLAAMWLLSGRLSALVGVVAAVFYVLQAAADREDRVTVIIAGVILFAIGLLVRNQARMLAFLLEGNQLIRKSVVSGQSLPARGEIDRSARGVRTLTRREVDVVRLAAAGLTSREIGRQLNIGARTVETHLGGAYSKLRIRSRAELMRIASQLEEHS